MLGSKHDVPKWKPSSSVETACLLHNSILYTGAASYEQRHKLLYQEDSRPDLLNHPHRPEVLDESPRDRCERSGETRSTHCAFGRTEHGDGAETMNRADTLSAATG